MYIFICMYVCILLMTGGNHFIMCFLLLSLFLGILGAVGSFVFGRLLALLCFHLKSKDYWNKLHLRPRSLAKFLPPATLPPFFAPSFVPSSFHHSFLAPSFSPSFFLSLTLFPYLHLSLSLSPSLPLSLSTSLSMPTDILCFTGNFTINHTHTHTLVMVSTFKGLFFSPIWPIPVFCTGV